MNEELRIEIARLTKAVDDFAELMKIKLIKKAEKGYRGWDSNWCYGTILGKMHNNRIDEDWVDVANLAMMLHRHKKEPQS
jgi:hypothetical protein